MRKTQNFLRRAGSAALALTLTVSLCQPAFAATKAPFSKDETVYAVMAADGSVTKTTVSEHLYNADGLAGVEDKSTLKNIVNTESFAEYTRNGDTLVWNTDDTDVYYKGETDRQLPISAKVTYTLDGRTAPLSELLGKSGHLVLTIDLTNHETGKVTVNGKERTIVTPLVTAVGVVLGEDAGSVNAVNGLLESAAKSSVAAFVTLPGVKESLDGLLPEQVNGVTEYLQDSVTVEADVESLTAPQILLACAASAEALGQGDEVFDLDSLNDLTDGIAALNDAMNQLLDGASQLKAGAAQLAAGSLALLEGANRLDSGLGQLTEGLDTLTSNNAALTSGAQQVADGVLDSANQTLMENGLIDTPMTWDTYEAVIDDILSLGDKTLAAGRRKMVRTIWEQAPQFKASQLDIALYLAATRTDHDLEAALRLMQSFSPDFIMGWLKKLTDSDAQQKIHDELVYQTANSEDMASVRALKENLGQIRFFVSSVGQYADGVAAAADGAHAAKAGSAQLAGGASALYDGVLQLQNGTDQLSGGLVQFNEEGISQLTGALDADQLHALQTVVEEMTGRLADYTSFAGAPEGASSRVKFLYKTAETPAETAPVETAADNASEGNFFLRLWHRLLALFGL